MRNIFKSISIAIVAAAALSTTAVADEICYNLCMSCRNTERAENCDKIESTCNCPFVIDSARSKNMGVELGKRKLIDELVAGCTKTVCARTLTFQDGYYKGIEKGNTTLTRFELIAKSGEAEQKAMGMLPRVIKDANATIDSLSRRRSLLPIAPMSMECTERCNDCASGLKVEPGVVSADSIAKADSARKAFCRITETSCQCKLHADNTLELIALDKEIAAKTAAADSLVKIKSDLLREEMARAIADSVHFFEDVDAALCVHPGDRDEATHTSLANLPVDIEFWGKPSHAAAAPEKGINALDALILTYNGISALRQHVTPDIRIHGIITHGGDAPNIVPEYAAAKFYLRAATVPRLNALYDRIKGIVKGAAEMTGAKGRIEPYQVCLDNTIPTPSFDAVYAKELALLGRELLPPDMKRGIGSSDVGNVSQVIPTIQPSICITDGPTPWHTEEAKAAAGSEKGLASVALGAKALALTALDLIEDPALLEQIKEDHKKAVAEQ